MDYFNQLRIPYHVLQSDSPEEVPPTSKYPLFLVLAIAIAVILVSFILVMIFIHSFIIRPKQTQIPGTNTEPITPPTDAEEASECNCFV